MINVTSKFFQLLHHSPDQDLAKKEWKEYISKQKVTLKGENKNIILEIEIYDSRRGQVSCVGWDFSNVNVEVLGYFRSQLNFESCIFESLVSKSHGMQTFQIYAGLNLKNCTFLKSLNLKIDIAECDLNFEGAKILGSECKIEVYTTSKDLNFINTKFGDNQGSHEIILVSGGGKIFFKNTKIYASKFLVEANCPELTFDETSFSDETELSLIGKYSNKTNLYFSNTTLSNSKTTLQSFGKISGDDLVFKNSKLLEFEGVTNIEVSKISDCQIGNLDNSKQLQIITSEVSGSVFKCNVRIQSPSLLIQKTIFRNSLATNGCGTIAKLTDCNISNYNCFNSERVEITNCKIDHLVAEGEYLHIKARSEIGTLSMTPNTNHLEVEDSLIIKSNFVGPTFSSCAIFSNVTFEEAPKISQIEFSSCNVEFRDIKFLDTKSGVAAGAFRALTKACSNASYEHGVILFHALELETRYNWHLKKVKFLSGEWLEKLFSLMHKHFTCYGTNLIRPIGTLMILCLLGYCFNVLCFAINSKVFDPYYSALVSLRNSLGPLMFALPEYLRKIDKIHNNLVNIFSFFQIIISSVIWFVLFFMIRRRFKI